jgi:glycosyltransferase involved in cell wall biosynthesis
VNAAAAALRAPAPTGLAGRGQGPIRVLLVISNLEHGGAQRQVVELANTMDPSRFDVHVCTLSDYVPLEHALSDRDRRLHVIQKRGKFDVTVVPRLAGLLRRLRTDVVHSFLFDADIAARLAGRLARTPAIVGSERNAHYRLKPRQRAAYWLTRRGVDVIVANSRAGAAFNGRALGHPPAMYRVVHNGVNADAFRPRDGRPVRRELGIGPDEGVVGMFASFKRQKNHPLFFAAARRLLVRHPATRLLLVGDELWGGLHGSDAYKRETHRLVDELGIRERCLFLGNVNDVARLYPACDVTVMPSLFEGTPNAVLESLACGVPVVATDVADNAYLVPDGRVGFVVPLGEADLLADRVGRLLEDAALRARMGAAARAWVEQEFSLTRLADKTGAVYVEVLGGARAAVGPGPGATGQAAPSAARTGRG